MITRGVIMQTRVLWLGYTKITIKPRKQVIIIINYMMKKKERDKKMNEDKMKEKLIYQYNNPKLIVEISQVCFFVKLVVLNLIWMKITFNSIVKDYLLNIQGQLWMRSEPQFEWWNVKPKCILSLEKF